MKMRTWPYLLMSMYVNVIIMFVSMSINMSTACAFKDGDVDMDVDADLDLDIYADTDVEQCIVHVRMHGRKNNFVCHTFMFALTNLYVCTCIYELMVQCLHMYQHPQVCTIFVHAYVESGICCINVMA